MYRKSSEHCQGGVPSVVLNVLCQTRRLVVNEDYDYKYETVELNLLKILRYSNMATDVTKYFTLDNGYLQNYTVLGKYDYTV